MKERITITLDKEVLEKTKKEANKENRSLSNYINKKLKGE